MGSTMRVRLRRPFSFVFVSFLLDSSAVACLFSLFFSSHIRALVRFASVASFDSTRYTAKTINFQDNGRHSVAVYKIFCCARVCYNVIEYHFGGQDEEMLSPRGNDL